MIEGPWLWLTFGLLALATTLPRAGFILAGARVRLPPHLQRALRYAPAAALAALVVPDLVMEGGGFQPVNPKLVAGAAVVFATLRWRNPWLPFIAGMAVLLLMRRGLGW